MSAKYRIVRDRYCGFEVQRKVWWWPLWHQAGGTNTFLTEAGAEEYARQHASPIVKNLGKLP